MDTARPLRVLSIEDHADTRLLLKHMLEETCEVIFASSVQEALAQMAAAPFDVLLVDIDLDGEETGAELLRRIRGREDLAETPAIAVTAYVLPRDQEQLLEEGFDEYVSKPFTHAELIEAINDIV